MFKLSFQEQLPSIEQAAIITRDRSLQGRQDAIDVLQRMLGELDNHPMALQLKEVLTEIVDNPSLITDELFGNIMSKTGEVLDATYDAEVGQVLNAARARGISGPALQSQIQRAKEAKAEALAGAYRDAMIARAQEGRSTQLQATQIMSGFLSNLFNQKSVLTQNLSNVLTSVVEEPFVNPGPPQLPQAPGGAGGGGGGGTTIGYDFSSVDAAREREQYQAELDRQRRLDSMPGQGSGGSSASGLDAGSLTDAERFGANQTQQMQELSKQIQQMRENMTPEQKAAAAASEANAYRMNGLEAPTYDANGMVIDAQQLGKVAKDAMAAQFPQVGSESNEAMQGDISKYGSIGNLATAGPQTYDPAQFGLKASPFPKVGYNISSTPEASARGGVESTIQGPGQQPLVFAGGAGEIQRAANLSKQFGMQNLIGTSEGAGVRDTGPAYQKVYKTIGTDDNGQPIVVSATIGAGTNAADFTGHWARELDPSAANKAQVSTTPTKQGQELLKRFVQEQKTKPKQGAGTVIRTSSGFGVRK